MKESAGTYANAVLHLFTCSYESQAHASVHPVSLGLWRRRYAPFITESKQAPLQRLVFCEAQESSTSGAAGRLRASLLGGPLDPGSLVRGTKHYW
ncbi:hypothetical protein NDU88_000896 [Pleurodeles waltl]|uniref:Uncharacterized protein n=1 Tax=Pleurodeles waltl TaxID=8319 RepID=A0AAV7WGT2_PLEWA|nr:hypothetical protein NDU88_000896 [Pleurodeles waltl]